MLVIKQKMIMRQDLRSNPDLLYVFGDNLERDGFGGQAKEMRGEENAQGVATKRRVTHGMYADYLHDCDPDAIGVIDQEFMFLDARIKTGNFRAVVLPADGLGTGLAKLQDYAPKLLSYINKKLGEIEHAY